MNNATNNRTWQWIGTGFFFLAAIAYGASFSGFMFFLAALLLCPPVFTYLRDYIKKPIWLGSLILSVILSLAFLPKTEKADSTPVDIPTDVVTASAVPLTPSPAVSAAQEDRSAQVTEEIPIHTNKPAAEPLTQAQTPIVKTDLTVHFIDVGQGDAALILCDGQTMLIDGGTLERSSLIVAYLKKQGISHLDYIINTHAHEDHIGGLSGALHACTVSHVFAPIADYDSDAFHDFERYAGKQGLDVETLKAGDTFKLGGAEVYVLAPFGAYEDHNDASIVLKLIYGNTSFLFTGDANDDAEHDMLSAGTDLKADVLKVGHHGSADATSYVFLREVMPRYAVISCSLNNRCGHPKEEILGRLRDADAEVFRTDLQGDIICTSDGENIEFETEKHAADTSLSLSGEDLSNANSTETQDVKRSAAESAPATTNCYYIGNKNSHKFHVYTCDSLPAEKNRVCFASREEAISAGYQPCGNCKP